MGIKKRVCYNKQVKKKKLQKNYERMYPKKKKKKGLNDTYITSSLTVAQRYEFDNCDLYIKK